jgi:hypothetical protein
MKMDLAVRPGRIFKTTLDLQSLDPNEAHSIGLSIVELTQWDDGEWQIIEPNTDFDTSALSSCKEWIRFRPTSVNLRPMDAQSVEVFLRVPPGIRGFYTAGILATPLGSGLMQREFLSSCDFSFPFSLRYRVGQYATG